MRSRRRPVSPPADWLAGPMMALHSPVEHVLGQALRRISRRQPGVFERLQAYGSATFLIAPAQWPVAFALTPRADGDVKVVPASAPGDFTARIEGRLEDLLDLFDGSLDADAAFFNRTVQVEGDTGAVLALHNALEAAELSVADLVPVGGAWLDRASRSARAAARRLRRAAR